MTITSSLGTQKKGSVNSLSSKTKSRSPLQEPFRAGTPRKSWIDLYRIDLLWDFDYALYMMTEARKGKENPAVSSPFWHSGVLKQGTNTGGGATFHRRGVYSSFYDDVQ